MAFNEGKDNDRMALSLGMDTHGSNTTVGVGFEQDGSMSFFAGHSQLFSVAGQPGRVTLNYQDKQASFAYTQAFGGAWEVGLEGLLREDTTAEAGGKDTTLIVGTRLVRNLNGTRLGIGANYDTENGSVLPYLMVAKRGALSDVFVWNVGYDTKSDEAVVHVNAQKIIGDNTLFGGAGYRGQFDVVTGIEHHTSSNNSVRAEVNLEDQIGAAFSYLSGKWNIRFTDEKEQLGLGVEYDVFSILVFGTSQDQEPTRQNDFVPVGNIVFEEGKEYAAVINEWIQTFRKANQVKGLLRDSLSGTALLAVTNHTIDQPGLERFMRAAKVMGDRAFQDVLIDFKKLLDETDLASYLGQERGAIRLTPAAFWELVYWRTMFVNQGIEKVRNQIGAYNRYRNEIGDLLGERFDPAKAGHVKVLRYFVHQTPEDSIGYVERYLERAREIRDYLVNHRGSATLPGAMPLVPGVDVTTNEGLQFLTQWVGQSAGWETKGLDTGRMIGYISVLLEGKDVTFGVSARGPPQVQRYIDLAERLYEKDRALTQEQLKTFDYIYSSVLGDKSKTFDAAVSKDFKFNLAYYLRDAGVIIAEDIKTAYEAVVSGNALLSGHTKTPKSELSAHLAALQYRYGDVDLYLNDIAYMHKFFGELTGLTVDINEALPRLYYWAKVEDVNVEGSFKQIAEAGLGYLFEGKPYEWSLEDLNKVIQSIKDETESLAQNIQEAGSFLRVFGKEHNVDLDLSFVDDKADKDRIADFHADRSWESKEDRQFNDLILKPLFDADLTDGLDKEDYAGLSRFLSIAPSGLKVKSINVKDEAGFIATALNGEIWINSRLLRVDTEAVRKGIERIKEALAQQSQKNPRLSAGDEGRIQHALARMSALQTMSREEIITIIIIHETGALLGFGDKENQVLEEKYREYKKTGKITLTAKTAQTDASKTIIDKGYTGDRSEEHT